ncbi:MAG: FKBP-type peptidyl-prolyl cis-trans isomerase [Oligoflexales bacterium]
MKKITLCLAFAVTPHVSCTPEPKTQKEKISWALGEQMGGHIHTRKDILDLKTLLTAIEHTVEGKKSPMTPEDMKQAMVDMRKLLQEQEEKQAAENIEKSKNILAENGKKKGVTTTESGLQFEVLKAVDKGDSPKNGSKVKVHYEGKLVTGEIFDSSYERKEPIDLDLNRVIKGWQEGIPMMKVGEKRRLTIPPELGYGTMRHPKIPPNSVLIFEVELLEILKAPEPGTSKNKSAADPHKGHNH